jgi:hypothetical protein
MRSVLLAFCLFVLGCGQGRPLDAGFAGHWTGTTTATLDGDGPVSANGSLDIAITGDEATMAGICLDGSGLLQGMTGAYQSIRWQGSFACPVVAFSDCQSVTMTYTTGAADLEAVDEMSAHVFGTAVGCGASRGFTIQFLGRK